MEALDLAELTEAPAPSETQELTETPENFLTKPFDEYTTTEGLLLIIALLLALLLLGNFWRRCTPWP